MAYSNIYINSKSKPNLSVFLHHTGSVFYKLENRLNLPENRTTILSKTKVRISYVIVVVLKKEAARRRHPILHLYIL